jgi:transcriptional regulator with XRE-family HTH domain
MTMSRIKEIRALMGNPRQEDIGLALGVTQGAYGFYERGEVVMPVERAEMLIDYASTKGLRLTLDQVYGRTPLPSAKAARQPKRNQEKV